MIDFRSNRTVALGEAMIEMAETGEGIYRKGFAGDTFNTAWHMAQIPDAELPVRFVTKVGTDSAVRRVRYRTASRWARHIRYRAGR